MKQACRKAFTEELLALAREDSRIVALTSDAAGSVTLGEFAQQLPGQFVETGIAEQNEIGVAGGMADSGMIPFVCAPAPFLSGRSYEQIKIDVAYNRRNVKLIGVSGGLSYGNLGMSHHSLQDIAALRAIPDLTVLMPSDGWQTRALTRTIARTEGAVYMRMGRAPVPYIYQKEDTFEIGKVRCLRDGGDVAILAVGEMVWHCCGAAELLSTKGIEATVLDMYSVKPMDREAVLQAAQRTGRLVTAEEHSVYGGLGGAVCELTAQACPVPVKVIGAPDGHIAAGESDQVYSYYHWTAEGIAQTVEQWLQTF